jgi:hypothetical protein
MRRTLLAVAVLAGLAACAGPAAKPITQAGATQTTVTAPPAQAAMVTTTTTAAPAAVASSCDLVREALLTGTQADIDNAMAGLIADRAADGTAREYADYYLHRDATEPSMRSMDVSLIRMSCA